MPRPLPTIPHGPRRRRRPFDASRRVVLACPRVSPEWELGALRVLVKPHDWTRGAIEHRRPAQPWPLDAAARVAEVFDAMRQRLALEGAVHFPTAGDFQFLAELPGSQPDEARALALAVSRRLPGIWLTLDRLFVRDGRFFRRERRFKLNLVEATNVRLPRGVRAKLKGVL